MSEGEGRGPRRKRLSIVIYSAFPCLPGGRESWLFHVLQQLDAAGYAVDLYSYRSDRTPFHDLTPLTNLRLFQTPTIRYRHRLFGLLNKASLNLAFLCDALLFTFLVYRRLRARHPKTETILAMNPVLDVAPALLYKKAEPSTRVVCSVGGRVAWELSRWSPWLGWLLRRLERDTLRQCDLVLANGHDTQAYLASIGVPSLVVRNGVDVRRFASRPLEGDDPAAWLRSFQEAGQAIIMMVATLWPVKGIHYLIHSAQHLRSVGVEEFCLVFVGNGPQEPYRRLAERLGVADKVHFAGQQRQVEAFLRWADISVNLSGGGGISLATLEAMATGKAVVAWDTPVYRQLIQDGVTGLLVRPQDSHALAESLRRLLGDEAKRRSLGAAAQQEARKYDWSVVAQEFLAALGRMEEMGAGRQRSHPRDQG